MSKKLFSVSLLLGLFISGSASAVIATAGFANEQQTKAVSSTSLKAISVKSDLNSIAYAGADDTVQNKLGAANAEYVQVASRYNRGHSRYRSGRSYSRRSYRRGYSNNGLGYLVGGLIIGGVLADRHHDQSHSNSRYDSQHSGNTRGLQPVYWQDKYGDCFRLEQRNHGDVYVQVDDGDCHR